MANRAYSYWDEREERLSRAARAVQAFESALERPDVTLSALSHRAERYMATELANLVRSESHRAEQLVAFHLGSSRSGGAIWAQVIALALIAERQYDLVVTFLASLPASALPGAIRAVALAADPSFDARVLRELGNPAEGVANATWLEIVAQRRLVPAKVAPFLNSADPCEIAAALRAATATGAKPYRKTFAGLLKHPVASVRDAAMSAGLHVASGRAWAACKALALEDREPHPEAMRLVAGLGGKEEHAALVERLASPPHRLHAIRALGFAGDISAVPVLLEFARGSDRAEARLAAEAISTLTGLDAASYCACPHPARPSAETAEELLPMPDPDVLASWWSGNRMAFGPDRRYLGGQPRSLKALVGMIATMPLRRTQFLARLLSTRTGGRLFVDSRALTSVQRAQIAAVEVRISSQKGRLGDLF